MKKDISETRKEAPWADDLTAGYYIDDNSLYVFESILSGRISNKRVGWQFAFQLAQPIEWTRRDMIEFLAEVAKRYNLKLIDINVNIAAIYEEYLDSFFEADGITFKKELEKEYAPQWKEYIKKQNKYESIKNSLDWHEQIKTVPIPPRKYTGAYEWALKKLKHDANSEMGKLISRILNNKLDVTDIYLILKHANEHASDAETDSSREIFSKFTEWLTFAIDFDKNPFQKLNADIDVYLEKFIRGELAENKISKKIQGNLFIKQNINIFTFNAHKEKMFDLFALLYKNFGKSFQIEDTFQTPELKNYANEDLWESNQNDDTPAIVRSRYANRKFLFMHIMFALEKMGLVEITSICNNWDIYEDQKIKTYEARIELLPLAIKAIDPESNKTIPRVRNTNRAGKTEDETIREIIFIERNAKPEPIYRFCVNNEKPKLLRSDSSKMRDLLAIANNENILFNKDTLDYINSNKECALYYGGKYPLANILERRGDFLKICNGIHVRILDDAAYNKRIAQIN